MPDRRPVGGKRSATVRGGESESGESLLWHCLLDAFCVCVFCCYANRRAEHACAHRLRLACQSAGTSRSCSGTEIRVNCERREGTESLLSFCSPAPAIAGSGKCECECVVQHVVVGRRSFFTESQRHASVSRRRTGDSGIFVSVARFSHSSHRFHFL